MSKEAIYDNPHKNRREWWIDGRPHAYISMSIILSPYDKVARHIAEQTLIPWKPGRIDGDKDAIDFSRARAPGYLIDDPSA